MSSTDNTIPAPADWRTGLPDDLKADPSLSSFKTVADVAKSYVETKKLVGASIRPPGPDAPPEARKEFVEKLQAAAPELVYLPDDADDALLEPVLRKLGKPAKADEYQISDEFKDAVDADDFRKLAEYSGLTKKQFGKLVEAAGRAAQERKVALAKEQEALKRELGAAYEERVLTAKVAAMKMGKSEAAVAAMTPSEIREYMNIAKALGTNPSHIQTQADGGGSGTLTPMEAEARLQEIRNGKEYWDPTLSPSRREYLDRKVLELTRLAHPG